MRRGSHQGQMTPGTVGYFGGVGLLVAGVGLLVAGVGLLVAGLSVCLASRFC